MLVEGLSFDEGRVELLGLSAEEGLSTIVEGLSVTAGLVEMFGLSVLEVGRVVNPLEFELSANTSPIGARSN